MSKKLLKQDNISDERKFMVTKSTSVGCDLGPCGEYNAYIYVYDSINKYDIVVFEEYTYDDLRQTLKNNGLL